MTFIVRQISQRADGGEIVRERRLAVTELSVGRGTDCDIQIADLGIMLRHARLRMAVPGRIAVESLCGVPLEVGGAFVSRADIALAEGAARIGMGSHRITLADAGDGAATVTIERIAAPGAALSSEEARVFSLESVMPGKRGMAWLLVAAVLLPCIAWPLLYGRGPAPVAAATPVTANSFAPDRLWSSGPLSNAHAQLSNSCGACHVSNFVPVTDAACAKCHAATPDHAAPVRLDGARPVPVAFADRAVATIHQRLDQPPGRCASCHREHEGPAGALTVAPAFCTDCHAGLTTRLRDTKLLNVADWSRGHPQFRPTLVIRPSDRVPTITRVSLDARPVENSGLKFPHALHLSATNGVARMAREVGGLRGARASLGCADCHTPDSDRVRFRPIAMERNCAMCHDLAFDRDGGVVRTLPHGRPEQVAGILRDFYLAQALGTVPMPAARRAPGMAAEVAASGARVRNRVEAQARTTAMVRAVFSRGGACFGCHAVVPPADPAGLTFGIAPVTLAQHYLPKGRFPHGRHTATPCATCHAAGRSSSSADVLLPPIATCRGCHGDPGTAAKVASTCQTCHGFHVADGHPVARRPTFVAARAEQ